MAFCLTRFAIFNVASPIGLQLGNIVWLCTLVCLLDLILRLGSRSTSHHGPHFGSDPLPGALSRVEIRPVMQVHTQIRERDRNASRMRGEWHRMQLTVMDGSRSSFRSSITERGFSFSSAEGIGFLPLGSRILVALGCRGESWRSFCGEIFWLAPPGCGAG